MTQVAIPIVAHARFALLAAAVVVGLLAGSLIVPAVGTVRAQTDPVGPIRSINVSGSGHVDVTPDVADVQLGVTSQRKTARTASREAARAMNKVVSAVIDAGVDEQDIQTTRLNLDSRRRRDPDGDGPPKVVSWEARNLVRVTVRDIDSVGDVIDAAIAAGATDVNRLTFRVDDPTAALASARSAAVADAAATATQLAADAGVEIIGVLTITEGGASQPRNFDEFALKAAAGPSTRVFIGSVDVVVNVLIDYEIGES